MRWMIGFLVLVCGIGVTDEVRAQSEMRTFTSKDGKATMKARILRTIGERVEIERDNGKKYVVVAETFQADDAKFIKKWIEENPAAVAYSFSFKEQEKKRSEKKISITGFKYFQQEKWYYDVAITSKTKSPLKDLTIKYRVWKDDQVKYYPERQLNRVGLVDEISSVLGEVQLASLGSNETKGFKTVDVSIDRARASSGYILDGRKNERDRMRGVWIRIYQAGKMIHEWKSDLIPPKAVWESEPEDE